MFTNSATRATGLSIWGVYARTHTPEMETAVAAVADRFLLKKHDQNDMSDIEHMSLDEVRFIVADYFENHTANSGET
jgi:hypothetical protein